MANVTTTQRPRAGNGEDTSFTLPNGKVKVQISLYDENGVRRRRSKTIDGGSGIKGRIKEAKKELHDAYPDGRVHAPTVPGIETTVGEVMDQWAEHYLHDVARSTSENYCTMVRKHVKPTIGAIPLADLRTSDVNHWLRDMATETDDHRAYSKATIKLARKVLVMGLEHARSERRVTENVAKDAKVPDSTTRKTRSLSEAEIKRFQEAAKGDRYEAAFLTHLGLGLRIGEVLALSWSDKDGNVLHIRRSQRREGGSLIPRGALKTESSHRKLELPKAVSDALWTQNERRVDDEEASDHYSNPDDLIFADAHGGPTRPETYRRHLVDVFKKADIHDATSHSLRHTYASLLVDAGVSLGTVADALGHSDMSVLVKTYRHATTSVVSAGIVMDVVLAAS